MAAQSPTRRPGGGPVLLLIHGMAGTYESWQEVIEPLARHHTVGRARRSVICWRGTRPSACADGSTSLIPSLGEHAEAGRRRRAPH